MWTKPLSLPLILILLMCSLAVLAADAVASAPGDSSGDSPRDLKIENAKLVIDANQKAGTYTISLEGESAGLAHRGGGGAGESSLAPRQ